MVALLSGGTELPSTGRSALTPEGVLTTLASGSTRTVERALELLAAVCAQPAIWLTGCAPRAALPAHPAHRVRPPGRPAAQRRAAPAAHPRFDRVGLPRRGRHVPYRAAHPP